MKKILYILTCLSILLSSCDKNDDYEVEVPPAISVSTWVTSFDKSGGREVIAISASEADWKITNNLDWITTTNDLETLEITVEKSEQEDSRSGYIFVTIKNAKDSVYIHQLGSVAAGNLSENGTANCYIAKTENDYSFEYKIRGNGGTDGGAWYINQYGEEITGAVYADLLWEATFDGNKTTSAQIINGKPVIKGDFVYFKTGTVEGNAVISVKSTKGEILWSWHIWVSNDEVTTMEANGYQWMNRNLGALNNSPGNINNRGLLYQWGRKDGFLPTIMSYEAAYANPINQTYNTQTGNGAGAWNYAQDMFMLADPPGNMPFTVRNPMAFIKLFGNPSYKDWFILRVTADPVGNQTNLWGTTSMSSAKTIFDPCPVGYIVPPANAWKSESIEFDWSAPSAVDYGRYWVGKNANMFFPAVGDIDPETGELSYLGQQLGYWTRTSLPNSNLIRHLRFTNDAASPLLDSNKETYPEIRVFGLSVRCVKE